MKSGPHAPPAPRTLADLPPGGRARIAALEGTPELRTRLRSLGLRPGREVAVVRRARFGGPLQVRLGTSDLIIRPRQARAVVLQ